MNLPTLQHIAPALSEDWIERIFQRLENFYMAKWTDSFGGIPRERVKQAWAEELAGYTGNEIKNGLEACRGHKWPPTLPEFLMLCRKPSDIKADWLEACEQMPIRLRGEGTDKWTRAEVYWAAVKIGAFDLHSNSWDQVKARWQAALENAKSDPIPEYRAALPAPGEQIVTKDEAVKRAAELKNLVGMSIPLGTTKAGTKWAVALLEREANGGHIEFVAGQMWREALGYPKDADAKAIFQSIKDRNSA